MHVDFWWDHPGLTPDLPSRGEEIKPTPWASRKEISLLQGSLPTTNMDGRNQNRRLTTHLPSYASIHDQIFPKQCFGHMVCVLIRVSTAMVNIMTISEERAWFIFQLRHWGNSGKKTQAGQVGIRSLSFAKFLLFFITHARKDRRGIER